ncbi:MAG: Bacteriophage tail fiber protein [Herminiimonas sp.]|nr:Bacteriophage tail fiber protein [Herminiimonas sp.]
MFRIDDPSAAAALPAPEAAGTEGYFTEGNPGVTAASLVRASFLNMIQEELRAITVAGGQTPSKTTYNQVLLALQALFVGLSGNQTVAGTKSFSSPPIAKNIVKAWVTFDGATGTIKGSHNVSSVTRNSVGDYNVNFPGGVFADLNYCPVGSLNNLSVNSVTMDLNGVPTSQTTNRLRTGYGLSGTYTLVDMPFVTVIYLGS